MLSVVKPAFCFVTQMPSANAWEVVFARQTSAKETGLNGGEGKMKQIWTLSAMCLFL